MSTVFIVITFCVKVVGLFSWGVKKSKGKLVYLSLNKKYQNWYQIYFQTITYDKY